MMFLLAAALSVQAPQAEPQSSCPDSSVPASSVCRALQYQQSGDYAAAAREFEAAATASPAQDPATSRMWAAAGNLWLAANEPGKAAQALDRALAGTGLQAEQRGEALLDRARAAEGQDDLATARAKLGEAAASLSDDPYYWYFSTSLAMRAGDAAEARRSINRALALAPSDPLILFEAGHVAQFEGDSVAARAYWTRAVDADPESDAGQAARDALALLDDPGAVQTEAQPSR